MKLQKFPQLPPEIAAMVEADSRSQFGALCYRKAGGEVQVLLITSRGTGRWIVPKGWPVRGQTPAGSALIEAALAFAFDVLEEGGTFVAKVLAGGAENEMQTQLKKSFKKVANVKPPASRADSSEKFVVAQGFRGRSTLSGSFLPNEDDQD